MTISCFKKIRTCNKPAPCFECGLMIPKKSRYFETYFKDNGKMFRSKVHVECDALREALGNEVDHGYLKDELAESGALTNREFTEVRRKWAEIIWRYRPRSNVHSLYEKRQRGVRYITNPKAKKDYACNECGYLIKKKERYVSIYMNTKPLQCLKIHENCAKIHKLIQELSLAPGLKPFGRVKEILTNNGIINGNNAHIWPEVRKTWDAIIEENSRPT